MSSWFLSNPAGLAALAALGIPVLIHLLSRSRGRRVPVGNIELFRTPQKRRINQLRLTQWLLLLLRCLLLALAALLLAGLAKPGLSTLTGHTVYVTEGRSKATDVPVDKIVPRSNRDAGMDQAPELPSGGEAVQPGRAVDRVVRIEAGWPWLAERLATVDHPDGITILTLDSASDRPPQTLLLPDDVRWQHAGEAPPREPARRSIVIAADDERQADAHLLQAALEAADAAYPLVLEVKLQTPDAEPAPADAVIWLSAQPLPDALSEALDTVILSETPALAAAGQTQLLRPGANRLLYPGRLGPDPDGLALQDHWPDLLAQQLLGPALWRSGTAHAPLPGDETALAGPASGLNVRPSRPLAPALALLIALLFLTERWLAERSRRPHGMTEP